MIRRFESIDAFRGFTIFAMIFVIMIAGYSHLPWTFPHFGSAPVSTFKHAADDGRSEEWAFWEGRAPSTIYRPARVIAASASGHPQTARRHDVAVLNERGEPELIAHDVTVWAAAPLRQGEKLIAVREGPAGAYAFEQIGIGCTFTDLVAPFFVFIVGLCIPLSRERRGADWWAHVGSRTLGLIAAGVVYISLIFHLSYWWGILQAIGVAYFMGAAALLLRPWQRWIAVAIIASVHWWATWHLPWWVELGDPSRPFWTVVTPGGDPLRPLTVHCTPWASIAYGICAIVGTLVGDAVATRDPAKIVRQSALVGTAFAVSGYLLHRFGLPMHKDYVSSSYAIFTSGIAALAFLCFFIIIDVLGMKRWAWLFGVFGVNALLAYFMQPLARIGLQALGLYEGLLGHSGWSGMLAGLEWTILLWCFVWWFNRKGIYWRL